MWLSKPVIDKALPFLDKSIQQITNDDVLPKCEYCGGAATMNVRGGDYFLEDPYEEQADKYVFSFLYNYSMSICLFNLGFPIGYQIQWKQGKNYLYSKLALDSIHQA